MVNCGWRLELSLLSGVLRASYCQFWVSLGHTGDPCFLRGVLLTWQDTTGDVMARRKTNHKVTLLHLSTLWRKTPMPRVHKKGHMSFVCVNKSKQLPPLFTRTKKICLHPWMVISICTGCHYKGKPHKCLLMEFCRTLAWWVSGRSVSGGTNGKGIKGNIIEKSHQRHKTEMCLGKSIRNAGSTSGQLNHVTQHELSIRLHWWPNGVIHRPAVNQVLLSRSRIVSYFPGLVTPEPNNSRNLLSALNINPLLLIIPLLQN